MLVFMNCICIYECLRGLSESLLVSWVHSRHARFACEAGLLIQANLIQSRSQLGFSQAMMTYYIGMVALPAVIVDHVCATLQSQCPNSFIAQGMAHTLIDDSRMWAVGLIGQHLRNLVEFRQGLSGARKVNL